MIAKFLRTVEEKQKLYLNDTAEYAKKSMINSWRETKVVFKLEYIFKAIFYCLCWRETKVVFKYTNKALTLS